MAANTDCLYTTVQNISGAEAVFSFLPPHGKRMAANELLTVAGNIIDRLAAKTSKRQFQALERALLAGKIAIISTPAVFVMTDPGKPYTPAGPGNIPPMQPYVPPTVKMIDAPAGTVGAVDPCWG